jgi:DUF1365 family protein
MTTAAQMVRGRIHHARRGGASNAFTYTADFVLAPMTAPANDTALFKRNRPALFTLLDRDHGAGAGDALAWARANAGAPASTDGEVWLLTQPRLLGFVFNPVSFWFFTDKLGALRAVLAEVNNVPGERCAYLCARPDRGPIGPGDEVSARKAMYVSPFQRNSGGYVFRFNWREKRVGVQITFRDESGEGMFASIDGAREPMSDGALARTALTRPFGSFGVLALIVFQALKLRLKGERFRTHVKSAHNVKTGRKEGTAS